jgi:hypothetical protein
MVVYLFDPHDDYKLGAHAPLMHARSFSLDSSSHHLDCQPNGDDCDRYSPKQIRHFNHLPGTGLFVLE